MNNVVLVHGLWVPGVVMSVLGARLASAGFRCHCFGYFGRARPLHAHAERLARFARGIGPAHYVGHSMGGLVILDALEQDRALPAGRVLLLGTPARGCMAGRRLARHAAGRWFLGESEDLWRESERHARWRRPEPLGVIAGTLPLGLGCVLGRLPGVNDGVVRLEETEVEGMAARVVMRTGHSAMLLSSRVAAQAVEFLRTGAFLHAA
ncbi:MAG: alpha/beta fold hydrolase [Proteobacteria bacterium]|nr:alpha/beta fold hydrolase [Pseudomonadota bacterium]